jgi:hypothetical protein
MNSEREYRLEAARCLLAADREHDPGRRIQLTRTAAAWLEVAVQTAINEQGKSAVSSGLSSVRALREGPASSQLGSGRVPILRAER